MKKLKLIDKIETERLIIQMPKIEDSKEIYNLIDEGVTEFMYWYKGEDYKSIEDFIVRVTDKLNAGESWESSIKRKEDNRIVGSFGIIKYDEKINSIELGYWIGKEFWGKGYIPECVERIKEFGFNKIGASRIVIIATKENTKSRRVAEKCGFKLDGVLRGEANVKGTIVDKAVYTLLKKDLNK